MRFFLALVVLVSLFHLQPAEAQTPPCPPDGLSIDGAPPAASTCAVRPSGGGVRNGELFSTDFGAGTVQSASNCTLAGDFDGTSPSNAGPNIVNEAGSLSGKALRYNWTSGFENYLLCYKELAASTAGRKLHVRIHYKMGANPTSGIQKTIRFRPYVNGVEQAIGTLNQQGGQFLYGTDAFKGDHTLATQRDVSTHGPQTFVNRWRWLEVMQDHTDLSKVVVKAWVDGHLIIDHTYNLSSPADPSILLRGVHILGTFNAPAQTRTDHIDKIDFSRNYMGVP